MKKVTIRAIPPKSEAGFTLIELSIVLVIIGLITGGILVGRDLISAAEVRSQISQIEKYNQAVNTFRSKFGAIPGDMAVSTAQMFGFGDAACAGTAGLRDGNGLVDGNAGAGSLLQGSGETGLFWQDISSANAGNLVDGQYPNSGANIDCTSTPSFSTSTGTTYIADFMPAAKIGHGSFVYVYENSGYNWYGLSYVGASSTGGQINNSAGKIPVFQAYSIDKKIDDGIPTNGSVQAYYVSATTVTAASNAGTDSTTTCYNTSSNVYSVGSASNYGTGGNCALSFRFQ